MGRLFFIITVFIFALIIANDTVFAEQLIVADIQYEVNQGYTNVVIGANQKTEFLHYTLEDPYRIVIDLIGVVFCELEQKIEFGEGPVESIDIIKSDAATGEPGLDKYFYAADYIVIELKQKYPFEVFTSKDGKLVIARITADTTAAKKPQQAAPAEAETTQIMPKPPERIFIEDIEYEVNPQFSTLTVASDKDIKPTIYEEYNPYRIVMIPADGTFCELEETIEPMEGLIKSISINKAKRLDESKKPEGLFYPVKEIVIEPIMQLPFITDIADDGRITIVRIEGKISEIAKPQQAPQQAKTELTKPEEVASEAESFSADEKQQIIDEITQNLYKKQEELFTRKEQEEQKKSLIRQARDKAKAIREIEQIGVEELEDLMVKGEGVITLKSAQDTALSYSEPAAIAEEEIALSKTKVWENFRALFPNVKLKGSQTTGDVLGVDFIEKIYGVEAEHPLYQGGRLWNTYQQSKVNMDLAKVRYDKVVHDLDYKVAEAYYSVVTSVMNLKLQKELLQKVEEILKIAQKRHASGLSTDLEFFNVKSQYNQAQFQVASAERDLVLARFKLEQALGMDRAKEATQIGEVETELKFDIVDINLNKCLELAQEYHPDIIVNELLVKSNEYEEKIAKGKDSLKVDLTGFYGRSGSHYKTEPDKLTKDWNVGLKVSKPLWGNTASYSFTKEETKRKIGKLDRQGTVVNSGEFAILDAMNIKSGIEEAQIKMHKAENDLLEARRQINLEVKEAYYNSQEAIIQVKNSLEKVRYQKEAVKTAKAQAGLNEALQSQLLEAEIKLADERSLYIKALSDYNFSLAKLNKAIGIADYFSMSQDQNEQTKKEAAAQ